MQDVSRQCKLQDFLAEAWLKGSLMRFSVLAQVDETKTAAADSFNLHTDCCSQHAEAVRKATYFLSSELKLVASWLLAFRYFKFSCSSSTPPILYSRSGFTSQSRLYVVYTWQATMTESVLRYADGTSLAAFSRYAASLKAI